MIEPFEENEKTIVEVPGMIWTNGKGTDGRNIYLGDNLNKADFYKITEEEYQRLTSEQGETSEE